MRSSKRLWFLLAACTVGGGVLVWLGPTLAQQPPEKKPSSYLPVIEEKFDVVLARMSADKPKVMKRQQDLLAERYDLGNRPGQGAKMSRSKPIQEGVRAKLPSGVTWESLAKMSPDEIKAKGTWPKGFLPLPHPNHAEGGMVFPKFHIDEVKKQ